MYGGGGTSEDRSERSKRTGTLPVQSDARSIRGSQQETRRRSVMESFSAISNTEEAPGTEMLPALFWYPKVCRAVLVAIHSEFCYSIFIKTMFTRKQHRRERES